MRFGSTSATDEVLDGIDLTGKRVLVTGVSAGLGVETARVLAAHGADVVGTARDLDKARAATSGITGSLELVELDLASLASVRAAADRLAAVKPFDVIIANAGVMGPPLGRTADGFETQFGTNHLGHFVLVNRLVPHTPAGGRVVVLASSAHHIADVDLNDPNFETTEYSPYLGYGRAKTANVLFAVELDRRHKDRGVRSAAVHPGGIETELGRHMDPATRDAMRARLIAESGGKFTEIQRKTVPQGAATSVWAAIVAPADEVGGQYCENCHVAKVVPPGVTVGPMGPGVASYALDPETARLLWAKSEELVGERF